MMLLQQDHYDHQDPYSGANTTDGERDYIGSEEEDQINMTGEEPDRRSIEVVNVDDSNFRQPRRQGGSNGATPQNNRGNMPTRRNG